MSTMALDLVILFLKRKIKLRRARYSGVRAKLRADFFTIMPSRTKGLLLFSFSSTDARNAFRSSTKSWYKVMDYLAAGWCIINKMDPSVQQSADSSFVLHARSRNVKMMDYGLVWFQGLFVKSLELFSI